MCNLYEQMIAWGDYCRMMQGEALDLPGDQGELDLPLRSEVKITDLTSAVVLDENGSARLTQMRFSFPRERPGAPVFNLRSEGRRYGDSLRCLVPASAFFEFTAPADPKAKRKDRWRFTRTDGAWMGLPALFKFGHGNQPPGLALPTVDPGPDVGAVHNRQIVVLEPGQWRAWLADGDKAGFGPSPAETFIRVLDPTN
jgi:putative SOS response-associated peptidase YedK